ncbi:MULTISPECIES: hypothetical protein [Sphingobium]|uniref:Integral membrane protein Cj1412c n=1 Tax=Sphingobium fuliginis (strain ATCC 27551) TaxID=336203 RepID=A0ABQ1EKT2_SPHSA|nr:MULTISPECIES: hypothetical protein [Sphingobium]AJR22923.1 integral membrane protein Cj1412c [Sphingobium sp. YBL2]RYM01297.1 hypothetical protein EWH10_04520 [Sphingobium fuliginis]WDA38962.1 hypothetical protein PO876_12680 [Sphingobium sp. YC-XJ3]GFZ76457.1 hypothetical protein GCM10019071_00860 [Sphingobium fuliginis]
MEKFKRKVFYLGGFDPRGVRFYHQMYREQAEAYTRLSGERVEVSARRSGPASSASWTVTNHSAGVETDYEFLRWEDLVGKVWIRNPLLLAWRSIATYGAHARHMQFLRMRKLRPGPVITILYPPLLAVLIPLALALIPALPLSLLMPFWAAALIGIAVSVALSGRLLNKLIVPWLLRFMVYNHSVAAKGPGADMDERLDQFAARIVAEVDGPWDEVVFASHSNGTIYAMSVLRRILELRGDRPLPENFTVLTLGQVVPVIALRKDARWYHADLKALDDKPFRLVDFSAPPDGAAYHGVHPIRLVSDRCAARVDLLSPRFHLFYDPENYHGGWSNKYEAHFDYLRVGDRLSPVDYVSLTAGRRTIDEAIAQFRTIP